MIGSGNLKAKCVVSLWNLYHKSNEISVEIQGLDPNPKSIRMHSDSTLEDRHEVVEVFHSLERRAAHCLHSSKNFYTVATATAAFLFYLTSRLSL